MGKCSHNYPLTVSELPSPNKHVASYSRQGTPTPILPDFPNLKSRWAAVTLSGVALSTYSEIVTPRPCPSSSAGGWEVDPTAPLPTLGQVAAQTSDPVANQTTPQSGDGSPSSTASETVTEPAASTTAQGIAGQVNPNVFPFACGSATGCLAALLTIWLTMVMLL